jgi:hypothetical protein
MDFDPKPIQAFIPDQCAKIPPKCNPGELAGRIAPILGLFDVLWNSMDGPRAAVIIDDRTKELAKLTLMDPSVLHRPAPLSKEDLQQLLKISDKEFLAHSDEQRKNLIKRFAAVTYDSSNN